MTSQMRVLAIEAAWSSDCGVIGGLSELGVNIVKSGPLF